MSNNNITISNSMLSMFVNYSDGYKNSDEFKNEDIFQNISNDDFNKKEMYNDKYITSNRWILPDNSPANKQMGIHNLLLIFFSSFIDCKDIKNIVINKQNSCFYLL